MDGCESHVTRFDSASCLTCSLLGSFLLLAATAAGLFLLLFLHCSWLRLRQLDKARAPLTRLFIFVFESVQIVLIKEVEVLRQRLENFMHILTSLS